MKAIRIHEHGGTDKLQIDELPVPKPNPDEVLIKVQAAALNHLDIFVRNGIPGTPLPLIMGSDGAGVVIDSGDLAEEKSSIKSGDAVIIVPFRTCGKCFACLSGREQLCRKYQIPGEHYNGNQAQYVSVPWQYLLPVPTNMTMPEAAAFPLAAMTAYHMLIAKADVQPGQSIFIWGASSGIGSYAVQIARYYNLKVYAAAGDEQKILFARECGADVVFNYKKDDIYKNIKEMTGGNGVDVVFEHTGSQTIPLSFKMLAKGGKIVTCGATTGPKIELDLRHLFIKHQQLIGSTMGNRGDLLAISNLISAGAVKSKVSHTLPYQEIREAHHILQNGLHRGKVVVVFD